MSLDPYAPSEATVADLVVERAPARWRWLCVPFGHAGLMLFSLIMWWWLGPRPVDAPPANFMLEADTIWWLAKEALWQGGILLAITVLLLWALPRILVRHAAFVVLASVVATWLVDVVFINMFGPTMTNGEHLDKTAATYGVVLLVSSVVIRKAARKAA